MKTLIDHLSQYAAYHRDQRNILTHFVGIPMIVAAIAVMLSRPSVDVAGIPVSLALVAGLASVAFYFALDVGFGVLMAALLAAVLWFGNWAAAQTTGIWLVIGIGGFVVGWVLQFIGHFYEGRKPAFVDDLIGLLIGPLFIVAEAMFACGLLRSLQAEIEVRVGASRDGLNVSASA